MHKQNNPKWWKVYGWMLVMGGLLVVQQQLALTPGWRQVVLVLIVILTYSFMFAWIWHNQAALGQEERERRANEAVARAIQARERKASFPEPTLVQQHFREVMVSTTTPTEANTA